MRGGHIKVKKGTHHLLYMAIARHTTERAPLIFSFTTSHFCAGGRLPNKKNLFLFYQSYGTSFFFSFYFTDRPTAEKCLVRNLPCQESTDCHLMFNCQDRKLEIVVCSGYTHKISFEHWGIYGRFYCKKCQLLRLTIKTRRIPHVRKRLLLIMKHLLSDIPRLDSGVIYPRASYPTCLYVTVEGILQSCRLDTFVPTSPPARGVSYLYLRVVIVTPFLSGIFWASALGHSKMGRQWTNLRLLPLFDTCKMCPLSLFKLMRNFLPRHFCFVNVMLKWRVIMCSMISIETVKMNKSDTENIWN